MTSPDSHAGDSGKEGATRLSLYMVYGGVALISCCVLMFEILITRLISVATWHYFAFLSVSLAMFGMSAGAIRVYFNARDVGASLTNSSALCAMFTALSVCVFVFLPVQLSADPLNLVALTLALILFSIPFYFSGVCIALALTSFSSVFSRVYAADLLGGAIGCILVVVLSNFLDAPTVGLAVSLLLALASWLFGSMDRRNTARNATARLPVIAATVCGLIFTCNLISANFHHPLLTLHWVKGRAVDFTPEYEKWTPISYVTVFPYWKQEPFGWGFGSRANVGAAPEQKFLSIDGQAGTVLTEFHGDFSKIDYLKCDLSNVAHYLRPGSNVLVIGVGGGRDILSAMLFKQKSILGVELNEAIVDVLKNKFSDFTGGLSKHPGVEIVNAEARSYLERTDKKFDLIQASLIDTWAATTAGAYALAENALYTVEGWTTMLNHLSDQGVLSFTRWYIPAEPYELYRLASIASTALEKRGVSAPGKHVIAVVLMNNQLKSIVTLLVSRHPFSDSDISRIEDVSKELGFRILYSPKASNDANLSTLLSGKASNVISTYHVDITATTDDRPFFFNFERLSAVKLFDSTRLNAWKATGDAESHYGHASHALIYCLMICSVLAAGCIALPFFIKARNEEDQAVIKPNLAAIVYFGAIGAGFMLVEVSIMMRQSVFLGNPIYAMVVVLPSMLVATGAGSYISNIFSQSHRKRNGLVILVLIVLTLISSHALADCAYVQLTGLQLFPKAIVVALLIAVPATFMGMAMPIGMREFGRAGNATSWYWGVNGATSILASVATVALSLAHGISAAYFAGACCYAVAFVCFVLGVTNARGSLESRS